VNIWWFSGDDTMLKGDEDVLYELSEDFASNISKF